MATPTISVTTRAYDALRKMKRKDQSFSAVILENLKPTPQTCGELLAELERDFEGAPITTPKRLERLRAGRGRRSSRR